MTESPGGARRVQPLEQANENQPGRQPARWSKGAVETLVRISVDKRSTTLLFGTRRRIEPIGLTPSAHKVLNWTDRYCSRDERLAVLLHAMASTTWRAEGRSLASFVRDMGWDEDMSTFYRRRRRGIAAIVKGLQRDGIPYFMLPVPAGLSWPVVSRKPRPASFPHASEKSS